MLAEVPARALLALRGRLNQARTVPLLPSTTGKRRLDVTSIGPLAKCSTAFVPSLRRLAAASAGRSTVSRSCPSAMTLKSGVPGETVSPRRTGRSVMMAA